MNYIPLRQYPGDFLPQLPDVVVDGAFAAPTTWPGLAGAYRLIRCLAKCHGLCHDHRNELRGSGGVPYESHNLVTQVQILAPLPNEGVHYPVRREIPSFGTGVWAWRSG